MNKQINKKTKKTTPDSLYSKALTLAGSDKIDKAIQKLEQLLIIYPDHALAHNDLGVLLHKSGNPHKALIHHEIALKLQPQNITIMLNLATILYAEFNLIERAVEIYRQILSVDPHNFEALYLLGKITLDVDMLYEAKKICKRNNRKIILHIGYPKTGTTAIQSFCFQNQKPLNEAGICYPKAGNSHAGHHDLAKCFIDKTALTETNNWAYYQERLDAEIVASNCEYIVISSEYFILANAAQVTEIKEALSQIAPECDVRVVVYLRRHDLWFESMFNQGEKNRPTPPPWEMDIRDFVLYALGSSTVECSYLKVLERWATVFGDANIIARPYEAEQFFEGSLILDFFHSAGLSLPNDIDLSAFQQNESLSNEVLHVIGVVRRLLSEPDVKKVLPYLFKAQGRRENSIINDKYGKLSKAHKASIYRFFLNEYDVIAQKFAGRDRESLFIIEPDLNL